MTSYIGRHAELYDLFYAEKPYRAESQFIHQQLEELGSKGKRKLLDVACGTGRHAIEFAKLGYCVTGNDYSADMLAQAEVAVRRAGVNVALQHQDMRSFELAERFDVVTCLFDAIGYVLTNEGVVQSLQRMREHLVECGIVVIEFWHAAAMLKSFDPVRVRRWSLEDREVLRISETSLDVAKQTSSVAYTIYEHLQDGTYSKLEEMQQNRYFLVQEMTALLGAAGLEPVRWCAGFSPERTISDETWHVVVFARTKCSGDVH